VRNLLKDLFMRNYEECLFTGTVCIIAIHMCISPLQFMQRDPFIRLYRNGKGGGISFF